jgi:hypothetical protein
MARRRRAAARRVSAAGAALRTEIADEALAPAAQRREHRSEGDGVLLRPALVEKHRWPDPDDANPRRAARMITGFRKVESLARLLPIREGGEARSVDVDGAAAINLRRRAAAVRLIADYELSLGARIGLPQLMARIDGMTPGAEDIQFKAAARYREAVQALGPILCAFVLPVVLCNWTVTDLAEERGLGRETVHARLMAGLDRLVDFYQGNHHPLVGVERRGHDAVC